jgi:hypothetical protein
MKDRAFWCFADVLFIEHRMQGKPYGNWRYPNTILLIFIYFKWLCMCLQRGTLFAFQLVDYKFPELILKTGACLPGH